MFDTSLSGFLGSHARARLLAHFVARPGVRIHARALERHTSLGKRSIQLELARFVDMGLLNLERQGNRHDYSAARGGEWEAVTQIVTRYGELIILQDLLQGIDGLKAAFVFGSVARGDARPDSDIDLILYGSAEAEFTVARAILDAATVIDRPLDAKWYDKARFVADMEEGASFLPVALNAPKLWLIGSAQSLPRRTATK